MLPARKCLPSWRASFVASSWGTRIDDNFDLHTPQAQLQLQLQLQAQSQAQEHRQRGRDNNAESCAESITQDTLAALCRRHAESCPRRGNQNAIEAAWQSVAAERLDLRLCMPMVVSRVWQLHPSLSGKTC